MGDLILRRRMMVQEENHLVYSLYNQAVVAGTQINTGLKPMATGIDFTLLFDFDLTQNVTSGYGRLWKLIQIWNQTNNVAALRIGKKSSASSMFTCWWMGTEQGIQNSYTSAGRQRISVTHQSESDTVNISYKKDNGTRRNSTYTATYLNSPGNWIYFGGTGNTDNALTPGTITKAEVYDIILPAADINAFFA